MNAICVASHHDSLAALRGDAEFRALAGRDGFLIELRLDQYSDLLPAGLDGALGDLDPAKLVVTCRRPEEGGRRPGFGDETRLEFLVQAATRGARYVDLELATARLVPEALARLRAASRRTQVILSFHDFAGVPSLAELRALRAEAERLGADVVKLAVQPATMLAGLPLLELLVEPPGECRKPCLGLAMGEAGFWSRVLVPRFAYAAPFTFARGCGAPGTAPGQPTWRELVELYRYFDLRPDWPLYGVIGDPIAHSLSPHLHNAALRAAHLKGVYAPFRVADDPADFVRRMAPKLGLRGISVTIPHKESVPAVCAEVSPLARQIGAVNTLVWRDGAGPNAAGGWFGTNTDADAASDALAAALGGPRALEGRRVAILGAGGAARALAFGLLARGAQVFLCNRTPARARDLAHELGAACVSKEELARADARFDAVVNTTPVGMHPRTGESPLTAAELPAGALVYDTIYNPFRTELLRLAEARGLRTLEGLTMFAGQGAAQFELFTGQPAPRAAMEAVVRQALAAGTR